MSKLLLILLCLFSFYGNSQNEVFTNSAEEQKQLKTEISSYQKIIDSLKNRLNEIKESEVVYPNWEIGGGALSGFDFNSFSNWANRGNNTNSSASSINIGINGFINRTGKKHFWKNTARANLGWQRFKQSENDEDAKFEKIVDMVQLRSLYGHNVHPDIAISGLSEWESNLIDQNISPSYLDFSVGITWTPNSNFNSTIHPINYEFALSEEDLFESSLGAKLLFDYSRNIKGKVRLQSNFSGFLSYEQLDFLSNFTWRNSMNVRIIKGVGLGLEYAIRISKQETEVVDLSDNHLQSYIVMGMSFELP